MWMPETVAVLESDPYADSSENLQSPGGTHSPMVARIDSLDQIE